MSIAADYFDGQISRGFQVTLDVREDLAILTGEIERQCPLTQLRVSERLATQPRKVTFPDGAFLVVHDNAAFSALLATTGHHDSIIVRMQQSWAGTAAAVIACVGLLISGYLYGLPLAAKVVAWVMPESANVAIGREALAIMDQRFMRPSALPLAQQAALTRRFSALLPPRDGAPKWRLVFRRSKIGSNAFALPAGEIVITDELIMLLADDDAIMAVLSHELGHLHEHHIMRRLVQSAAVGAVTASLFGDVSSLLVMLPTVLLDLRYSRNAEREADDYAIAMMKANGISLSHMIAGFEKIGKLHVESSAYFSSHPLTSERIARVHRAQVAE